MAVSMIPSQQVKTKIVTTNFAAETWVTVPRPAEAVSILSLKLVSRNATNGYWLLWEDTGNSISALRINTSGTNLVVMNGAFTNAKIEVTYI